MNNPFGFMLRLFQRHKLDQRPAGKTPETDNTIGPLSSNDDRWRQMQKYLLVEKDRERRYAIYRMMDNSDLGGMVIDAHAGEASIPLTGTYDTKIRFSSKNQKIAEILNKMRDDIDLNKHIFGITREMVLMGDDFERVVYAHKKGVQALVYEAPENVERVEDKYGTLQGYKQRGEKFRGDRKSDVSWPWDFVHFRNLSRLRDAKYGTSILFNSVTPWKMACLAPQTLIWTTRGPVEAQTIVEGDVVYCHDPETQETRTTKVVGAYKQGIQRLLRIWTAHRRITVTEDHGMLVRKPDGSFSYKKAKDLIHTTRSGSGVIRPHMADALVLPTIQGGVDSYTVKVSPENISVRLRHRYRALGAGIMDTIRKLNLKAREKHAHAFLAAGTSPGISYEDYLKLRDDLPSLPPCRFYYRASRRGYALPVNDDLEMTLDKDFMRLFGFMLGDGWINKNKAGVGFALGVYENLNLFYVDLFKRVFRTEKIERYDANSDTRLGGNVQVSSSFVAEVFEKAGFISGFANKRIPEWMYGTSPEMKLELIRGICDADGQEVSGGWRLGISNKPLIQAIQVLAQQIGYRVSREIGGNGYVGKTTKPCKSGVKVTQRTPAYRIFISPPRDQEISEVVYEAVTKVEPVGEGQTYDITVEDDLHNFIADGVVSHNTMGRDEMLFYRMNRRYDMDVYQVWCGSQDPTEQRRTLKRFRDGTREQQTINQRTGEFNHQFIPKSPSDDLFLAKTDDSESTVERMPGNPMAGEMNDLKFYYDCYFATVHMPKEMFGFLGDNSPLVNFDTKKRLSSQNLLFARSTDRTQKCIMFGARDLGEIHLTLLADNPEDTSLDYDRPENAFDVEMEPTSHLIEYERLDLLTLRFQVAATATQIAAGSQNLDTYAWTKWILTDILQFDDNVASAMATQAAPTFPPGSTESEDLKHLAGTSAKKPPIAMIQAMKSSPALMEAIRQVALVRNSITENTVPRPRGVRRSYLKESLSLAGNGFQDCIDDSYMARREKRFTDLVEAHDRQWDAGPDGLPIGFRLIKP